MRLSAGRMDQIILVGIRLCSLAFSLFLCLPSFGQNGTAKKEEIEILNSDELSIERNPSTGKDWFRFLGNVSLKHNDVYFKCDSAHYDQETLILDAYFNIHIQQGDTLHMYGDKLHYDGNSEIAEMTGNVVLVNKETFLYTNYGVYNLKTKIANYTDSGRIVNGDNTLRSKRGIYYADRELIFFKDNVEITTPEYFIESDTMQYQTQTEVVTFHGPTDLTGDSLFMHCEKGWYDTKLDIASVWKNAMLDNRKQIVKGDSIYYDDRIGEGESFGNISISDTTNKMMVKGNYAWVKKTPETFMVTDSAMFVQFSDGDSLFMHADTLSSEMVGDTTYQFRLMRAYNNCKIFGEDLQARCDSLSYSFSDSVIRMYGIPIIWSDNNQLTSDSIALFTKEMNPDRLELYNSAFVINKVDSLRYDQIKGRNLSGFFRDNKLYRILVDGNGETIYHIVDNNSLVGVNTATCSSIDIFLEGGKIKEIFQYEPGGNIDPPLETDDSKMRLDGFTWLDGLRPKNVEDIFKR